MKIKFYKEVTTLPASATPDSVYFLKTGTVAELYVTDTAGNYLQVTDNIDKYLVSGAIVGNDIVITMNDGQTVPIDVTALMADVMLTSGAYNATTQSIDLTLSNAQVVSVPVSALIPVATDNSIDGDGTAATPLKIVPSNDANNIVLIGTDGKLFVDGSTLHTHANKAEIDKIGEDADGCPTYNGDVFSVWSTTAF